MVCVREGEAILGEHRIFEHVSIQTWGKESAFSKSGVKLTKQRDIAGVRGPEARMSLVSLEK